jgi:two-component system KDP operon response regulator KdpE
MVARDGADGLRQAQVKLPELVVLDLMLPVKPGLEVCRELRAAPRTRSLPIVMLTAKAEETDELIGLTLGADDYVTKPFSIRELVARIRAAVRRTHAPVRTEEAPIEIGEIRLVPAQRTITKRGQALHLTRKEFDILHCLMSRAGRVVTYARLLTAVWGADCREEVEYLRTFVRQLRKKIEDDPARPVYLLTDIYVGYRFADAQMLEEAQAAINEAGEAFGSSASPDSLHGPDNSTVIGHA